MPSVLPSTEIRKIAACQQLGLYVIIFAEVAENSGEFFFCAPAAMAGR